MDSSTDPLERAVLSGAIFAGRDPEGEEPYRGRDSSDDDGQGDDNKSSSASSPSAGFIHPSELPHTSSSQAAHRHPGGMSHNTGVKGVLADFREQQRQDDLGQSASATTSKFNGRRSSRHVIGSSGTTRDSESDELISDGEREAKESYRRKRMQEMMKMGSSERNGNSNVAPAGSRAKFGHLREIGQSQFVKAIEEKSDVTVVVHVYDPSIPLCNVLNGHLTSLARSYEYTKFMRAASTELEFATGDEDDVLPTLLVYRGGESVKTLVALEREFAEICEEDGYDFDGDKVTRQTVEELLIRHGVLQASSGGLASSSGDDDDD